MNSWMNDDELVYDDQYEFFAEYIADFDLEKAERILNRYSRASIARAALSKMKSRNG